MRPLQENRISRMLHCKKGYMRTVEVTIAISLSFIFITFVVFGRQPSEDVRPRIKLFSILEQNPEFRQCVIAENYSCLNSTIALHYPEVPLAYDVLINVSTDPNIVPQGLPQQEVFLESLFIAGNDTFSQPKVVRIYYWRNNRN